MKKTKAEENQEIKRWPIEKIIVFSLAGIVVLYLSLNNLIHPVKCVSAQVDFCNERYEVFDADDTEKQDVYLSCKVTMKNVPLKVLQRDYRDKIRLEPSDRLTRVVGKEV